MIKYISLVLAIVPTLLILFFDNTVTCQLGTHFLGTKCRYGTHFLAKKCCVQNYFFTSKSKQKQTLKKT